MFVKYTQNFVDDAKKKGQLRKQVKEVQKKKQCLRRVVEGLFLSNAGPKRGCLSYLIAITTHPTYLFL